MKWLILIIALGGVTCFPVEQVDSNQQRGVLADAETDNLSPLASEADIDKNSLYEVQEEDIPEGALVYVQDENPLTETGETLQTSNNIVFRPLFHYRNKQQRLAQRRASNRARRRYYMYRRPYRQAYYYPRYYYPRGYYY